MKPEMDPLMVKISPDHHKSSPSADTFTKPKSKPTISTLQLVVASLIFLAVTLGLLSVSYPSLVSRLNLRTDDPDYHYSVVIDAGSSGTRVHVFRYTFNALGNPDFKFNDDNYKKKDLLTTLASCDNSEKVSDLVKEILNKAKEIVPKEKRANTEIRLMATAGMRLLDENDQNKILHAAARDLIGSKFKFKGASVIEGAEEGKYAWVAANYANGTLGGHASETSGIVELGGASAQVAFVTTSRYVSEADTKRVTYKGVEYEIYSHSFLNLGQIEARKQLEDFLRKRAETSRQDVTDPCYPKGGYPPMAASPTSSLKVRAVGDFSKCELETDAILRASNAKCPKSRHCSIGSVYTPDLKGDFFALASFYYTPTYFKLAQPDWLFKMIPKATTFCKKNWSTIWENRDKENDKKEHLIGYCFSAAYTISMLHERLHFALEGDRIKFVKKVKGIPVDWPVGVLILNTPTATSGYSGISRKILG